MLLHLIKISHADTDRDVLWSNCWKSEVPEKGQAVRLGPKLFRTLADFVRGQNVTEPSG